MAHRLLAYSIHPKQGEPERVGSRLPGYIHQYIKACVRGGDASQSLHYEGTPFWRHPVKEVPGQNQIVGVLRVLRKRLECLRPSLTTGRSVEQIGEVDSSGETTVKSEVATHRRTEVQNRVTPVFLESGEKSRDPWGGPLD